MNKTIIELKVELGNKIRMLSFELPDRLNKLRKVNMM